MKTLTDAFLGERILDMKSFTDVLLKEYKTEWEIAFIEKDSSNIKYSDFICSLIKTIKMITQNKEISKKLDKELMKKIPKKSFSINVLQEKGIHFYFDEFSIYPRWGFKCCGGFYTDLFEDTVVYSNHAFDGYSSNMKKIEYVIPYFDLKLKICSNKGWDYQKKIMKTITSVFKKLGYKDDTLRTSCGNTLLSTLDILKEKKEFDKYLIAYEKTYIKQIKYDLKYTVTLDLNGISYLDFDKMFNLVEKKSAVKTLDLSKCKLDKVPSSILMFKNIDFIVLHSNKLTAFPEKTYKIKKLNSLMLDHNFITSLPSNIRDLKKIKNLYIRDNNLTSLPDSICELKCLEHLCLDNNSITRLPNNINNLNRLKILSLDNNNLTSLPENINKLTLLQELSLENNELTFLPETICELVDLYDLNLINNNIEKLPNDIGKLKNLYDLFLTGNPISDEEKTRLAKVLPDCEIHYNRTPLEVELARMNEGPFC